MSKGARLQHTRQSASKIAEFPDPPEGVTFAETRLTHHELAQFLQYGIVYRIPCEETGRHPDEPGVYRVDREAYEYAQQCIENTERLTCCGATGVTNDGGTMRCQECGAEVDEEEFRRVCPA